MTSNDKVWRVDADQLMYTVRIFLFRASCNMELQVILMSSALYQLFITQ